MMGGLLCSVGKFLNQVGAGQKLFLSVLLRTYIGTGQVSIAIPKFQVFLHATHDSLDRSTIGFKFLVAGSDNPLLSSLSVFSEPWISQAKLECSLASLRGEEFPFFGNDWMVDFCDDIHE